MRTTRTLLVAVLLTVHVAPAIAADADETLRNSAPPALEKAPPVRAPSDSRPDEAEDPSGEMLERWREEDRVEHRDERREERYEAEHDAPVVEDEPANGDAVEPDPHDGDELDRDLKLDDDDS